MKKCAIDNLDLEACINIIRDKRQDLEFVWEITGMTVAPEFILKLYNRINKLIKTYTITPNFEDVLVWYAPKEDFTDSIMSYSMTPTISISTTWIELKGQINSN